MEAREMGQHNKQAQNTSWNDTPKKGHFWLFLGGLKRGQKMAFFEVPSNTLALCWSTKVCCAWTNFMMQTHQAWRVAAETSKTSKFTIFGGQGGYKGGLRTRPNLENDRFLTFKTLTTTRWTTFNIIIEATKITVLALGGLKAEGQSGHENRLVGTSNI